MTKHWRAEASLCRVPNWVPQFALRYLAHTEKGISIRELARSSDVHASTVLRQIRRVESKRDDPLIDEALVRLGAVVGEDTKGGGDSDLASERRDTSESYLNDEALDQAAGLILCKLNVAGAVLAVAQDMDKAVVARDGADGRTRRTAVVDREVAQAMALQDWISCSAKGRISRYKITAAGQAKLAELMQSGVSFEDENSETKPTHAEPKLRRTRFSTNDGPVLTLARRKDRDGNPYLTPDLVSAAERLREDFELSQLGPIIGQNWNNFLTPGTRVAPGMGHNGPGSAARQRFEAAFEALTDDLAGAALWCCCHQEGLESVERRFGWPARSGKVVLRIALEYLSKHYGETRDDSRDMIG
ncbi:DUF6456 domain-containing protein [Cognatishimia maritima]|uniref:DUF6456 domain-containing protein n=1 Tax=Cognatishimia maritima TaxID=870908 RepID=A0A1M5I938_9RHOB|nr:DUF6456 domain-containing protein [Cognatishimia maritima]SHG24400.1 hypothetical protein SAMN04488044_0230 [Cognatishimia maritima]